MLTQKQTTKSKTTKSKTESVVAPPANNNSGTSANVESAPSVAPTIDLSETPTVESIKVSPPPTIFNKTKKKTKNPV